MSKKSPPGPVLNNVDGKGTYGLLHPEWGNCCLMCGAYKWRVDDFCCVLAIAGVVNSHRGINAKADPSLGGSWDLENGPNPV